MTKAAGTFPQTQFGPTSIRITDEDGVELTTDSDMPGLYVLEAEGAGTLDFYIDHDGSKNLSLININLTADAEVALQARLMWYAMGEWKTKFAYSMTLTGIQAVGGMSTAYPLVEDVPPGTKVLFEVTTAGACNVGVNATGRYQA